MREKPNYSLILHKQMFSVNKQTVLGILTETFRLLAFYISYYLNIYKTMFACF